MTQPAVRADLVRLFEQVARAHEAATGGHLEDPDWPLWYAARLEEPLSGLLGEDFHQAQIVHWLMELDTEHEIRAPGAGWAGWCADAFIEHFLPSDTPRQDELALYYTPLCGYCTRVIRVIERLGLEVEMRNTMTERNHWQALMDARGRATVPVLWIRSPDGTVRWMPESQDIMHYLERCYGA